MWEFFHSKTVQAISSWLAVLATVFTVLSKASQALLGPLTWPEATLVGIGLALATMLTLAVLLAVGAWGFRLLKPNPQSSPTSRERPLDHSEIDQLRETVTRLSASVAEHQAEMEGVKDGKDTLRAGVQSFMGAACKLTTELNEQLSARINELQDLLSQTAETVTGILESQGETNKALTERLTGLTQEIADHKKHMSDCYSAQDEARMKGLTDLNAELDVIRRGCASLSDTVKAVHNEMRESVNAILAKEKLAALSDKLIELANELYLPLKNGESYDNERWQHWRAVSAHFERVLGEWIDGAKWYAEGVKLKVQRINDEEYEDPNWGVDWSLIPDPDGVRQYKRHRIILAHWLTVKGEVAQNLELVAHGLVSEKDCHHGQYHR